MRSVILSSSLIFILCLSLFGCSTNINEYKNTRPALHLDQFFNGELIAYGMVQDRNGQVLRRFRVDMIGEWNDNEGVLKEDFYYDDGETQHRTWYLEKLPDGRYQGKADDVVKTAISESAGFAMNWRYTLALPVDGETWQIDFDDWMYLIDEKRLINRAEMRKWGLKVGEVTLLIEKK